MEAKYFSVSTKTVASMYVPHIKSYKDGALKIKKKKKFKNLKQKRTVMVGRINLWMQTFLKPNIFSTNGQIK